MSIATERDQEIMRLEAQVAKLSTMLGAAEQVAITALAAIRKHMNMPGDDRCFQDDHDLYMVLPEGDTRPAREVAVTLENCQRYITCRQGGREYVSPQRKIEELTNAVASLRSELQRRDAAALPGQGVASIQAQPYLLPPFYRHLLDDDGLTAFRAIDDVSANAVEEVAALCERGAI